MRKYKINFLLVFFAVTTCYIVISGYREGAASFGDFECTGAETGLGNPTGCNAGGGCHSSSATGGIAISIELDSVGVATTNYIGGMTYTVKITGTNNTASHLPAYGFQMSCIKGSVHQGTPTNEGTWQSPFPGGTHYTAPKPGLFTVGVVEQGTQLAPLSGSGGTGTVYSKTFSWVAPAKGTGTISFWGALNAVNDNGSADGGDLWNITHLVINEWLTDATIATEQNSLSMNIFPNPVTDYTTLEYTLKENIHVQAELFDISGKKVCTLVSEAQSAGAHSQTINLLALKLKGGIYLIVLNDGVNLSTKKMIVQ